MNKNILKKLFIVFALITNALFSQNFIEGTMSPVTEENDWIILYRLSGARQIFQSNTTVMDGAFKIEIPNETPSGMYRLIFAMNANGFVDIIYNNENVALKFNPQTPENSLEILSSVENKLYKKYIEGSDYLKYKLDSLQTSFFRTENNVEKENIKKSYTKSLEILNEFQLDFEKKSTGKLARNFIKARKKYYAPEIINTPQEYLNSEKKHFFDFIDFNDNTLINSTFLSEKVINYVFYLNVSDDATVQSELYKKAVVEVESKISKNYTVKSELLTTLLYAFAQTQNSILVNFILEGYYKKLPEEYINTSVIVDIKNKMKLALGQIAPEITWDENGVVKKLSELNNANTYIVVFWSSTCSHCLNEIPKLYKFSKNLTNVQVIGFAMETDKNGFEKHKVNLEGWINILGLGKWKNPTANTYEITSTPTYFILDSNKKIIAKPEFFEDVKAFFNH